MVKGIGVDIVKMSQLLPANMLPDDPFGRCTFSKREHEQAKTRDNPHTYYATRFAAKEAVYKALGWDDEPIFFREIEIENDVNGQPTVNLYGNVRMYANERGIGKILISLSHDTERAIAFAVAQQLEDLSLQQTSKEHV